MNKPEPPYENSGFVTCPGCGTTTWGSKRDCRGCGADVLLIKRGSKTIRQTHKTYVIDGEGNLARTIEPLPD